MKRGEGISILAPENFGRQAVCNTAAVLGSTGPLGLMSFIVVILFLFFPFILLYLFTYLVTHS